ncbi:DUF6285 domain-containing protein [Pseudomonas aeruginosa]|uniref:DUF6285 domain-containing protein n=1 Tax=Pseudomonas aeruginosa TaxID=287 RepID=UPI00053D0FCA|nr:DUF6285 domain-containing protein [Pseudomonas aeruginosa]
MSRQPDAAELLHTAREVLLGQLLPALPETLHYQARMIANAMAIAAREQHAPACPDLPRERELAQAIRRGAHDDGSARAELLTIVRGKLQISNPRLLAAYSEGSG